MSTTDDHDEDGAEVSRSVTTPLADIAQDAALAANMDPHASAVVDAGVTDDGELRLVVEGEQL